MDPTFEAVLGSWRWELSLLLPLGLSSVIYTLGWLEYRRLGSHRFPLFRWACFQLGLCVIFLALASPIEALTDLLLTAHMLQHLLLMMIAPPLLLLGAPVLPLIKGMPIAVRRHWIAPLYRSWLLRRLFHFLSHPVTAWCLFSLSTWIWHTPDFYQRTLASRGWHYAEHASFFGTALLFWWPVVQPFPSQRRWPRWAMIPYLLLADVQNTILSAIFCFSDRPLYPHYETMPRLWGLSALEDQRGAGVLMWIPGSAAFLVPVAILGAQLLFGRSTSRRRTPGGSIRTASTVPRLDLLSLPGLGPILRWRHTRRFVQGGLLALAALIVLDGFYGPAVAGMNLAGVLPWTHFRGLTVLALLVAGNLFCYACPFTLPRRLAQRWLPEGRAWPRRLQNKWLAVALLLLFFWSYEVFALWSHPRGTAVMLLAYFAAAFAIDSWFRAGSFCKYLCPVGQFHFSQSLVAPLEVTVHRQETCHACVTKDCIRGNELTPGCELGLFAPRKIGNLDCTFCLDCVHACPEQNVGVLAILPGSTLLEDGPRSGIGRLTDRPDILVMLALLVFAAFANAAGMVRPVQESMVFLVQQGPIQSLLLVKSVLFVLFVIVLPAATLAACAAWSDWFDRADSKSILVKRQILALVPLGASMWGVHFGFHFLTSYGTLYPVSTRFLGDVGLVDFKPLWSYGCSDLVSPWIVKLEVFLLQVGWLASLYLGYRSCRDWTIRKRHAPLAFLPWGVATTLLFLFGLWITFQPMEMRGTILAD